MAFSKIKRAIKDWVNAADGSEFVSRFEKTKRFRSASQVQISFRDGLYFVESEGESIAIARKARLHHLYTKGISSRRNALMKDYCIPDGLIRPGDFVIDCGANVGDFSVICAKAGAKVLAFEPDKVEFRALIKNSESLSVSPVQAALWKEAGEMKFFDANDRGDSSLIEPTGFSGCYTVKTIKLDEFDGFDGFLDAKVRLIKLEAEGAEPEILEGMKATLQRTDYITIDMGPERGISKENTVAECTDFLYANGFQMRRFFAGRCSALYENDHKKKAPNLS